MVDTQFYPLEVSACTAEGAGAVCLSLDVPKPLRDRFQFEAGQYITLRRRADGQDIRRTYSICSSPTDAQLKVGIRQVEGGYFSTFANQQLKAGDVLEVMPPQGRFVLPHTVEAQQHYIGLAAGSGITPIMSILQTVLEKNETNTFTLLYGNRSRNTIMFAEALADLKNRYMQRLQLINLLSQEQTDIALFNGRLDSVRVGKLIASGLITPQAASAIFICGPGNMIDQVSATLQQACANDAVPIIVERFMTEHSLTEGILENIPVGVPSAESIAQKAPSSTRTDAATSLPAEVEVEVILDGMTHQFSMTNKDSVIEAAAASGIELPFSCKGGMCATCRCHLKQGDANMSLNYSLQPWEIEAGYVLACQVRPESPQIVLDFDAT